MKLMIAGATHHVETLDDLVRQNEIRNAKTLFFIRHGSAVLPIEGEEGLWFLKGYCYGGYDPPLKEKGIKGAEATAGMIGAFIDEMHESPLLRAQQTGNIVIAGNANTPVTVAWPLRPATYFGVPESAIEQYQIDALAEDPEADAKLHKVYLDTGAYVEDYRRMAEYVMNTVLTSEGVTAHVSHDEMCRMMVAFCLGDSPKGLSNPTYEIPKGGYVEVGIKPNGNIVVTKVDAEGESETLREV